MEAPVLSLDCPNPNREDISTVRVSSPGSEEACGGVDRVSICRREIWRGAFLASVRDREKRGGEGRGTGFLQWLASSARSAKTRAYGLIQLARIAATTSSVAAC